MPLIPRLAEHEHPLHMNHHRFFTGLALAALATAPLVRADEITLQDGSVLKGKISAIEEGAIVFQSAAVADSIKIKQSDVTSFSTDGDIFLGMASQTVVKGKVESATPGTVKVTTPEGVNMLKVENIKDGWTPGSASPAERTLAKLKRHWEYTADISIIGKTGNRESIGESAGLQALNKSQNALSISESLRQFGGVNVAMQELRFMGVPVRTVDRIVTTEARVV